MGTDDKTNLAKILSLEESLPDGIKPWFRNLNDGTNEGIYFSHQNARSVQFHPESSPGPNDSQSLIVDFIDSI